jgi:hypothetical protein
MVVLAAVAPMVGADRVFVRCVRVWSGDRVSAELKAECLAGCWVSGVASRTVDAVTDALTGARDGPER